MSTKFGLYFTWADFVITPTWIIILFIACIIYSKRLQNPLKRLFIIGFSLRILISLVQSVLANKGFVSRDDYAVLGKIFAQKFYHNPLDYFRILMTSHTETSSATADITHRMLDNETTLIICKIGSLFDIVTFHTYSASTLLLSFIPFFCCWKLLVFLNKKYGNANLFAIPLLFVPSLILWSSAYMKDTITYATLVMLIYVIFSFNMNKKKRIGKIILLVVAAYLTFVIKSYILFIVVLSFLLLKNYNFILKPISPKFRTFVLPIYLFIAFGFIMALFSIVGSINPSYSLEYLIKGMKGVQGWIALSSQESGAAYTLGEYDDSLLGLLSIMPSAIGVCLFRPYLWEVQSPIMIFTALEGLLLFAVLILLFLKVGFKKIYFELLNDKLLFFLLVFSLLFLFVVGFSTYNFGSLARYKIPGQLTFYLIITILFAKNKNRKKQRVLSANNIET